MTTRESSPDDERYLLSAFLRSGGTKLSRAAERFGRVHPPIDLSWAPNTLGAAGDQDLTSHVVSQLNETGYAVMPFCLPSADAAELLEEFRGVPSRIYSDDPSWNGATVPLPRGTDAQAEKYSVLPEFTVQSERFSRLVLDRTLLAVASEYFGAVPTIDSASIWLSAPSSAGPSREAAQMFHFDLERIKWLKVFIFLADVTKDSGAHVFVPGTHKDKTLPRRILARGYTRLSDDFVDSIFPRASWFIAEGKIGTILIEDTRGLHKGTSVRRGTRPLAQIQYSLSLFGAPSHLGGGSLQSSTLFALAPAEYRRALLPLA